MSDVEDVMGEARRGMAQLAQLTGMLRAVGRWVRGRRAAGVDAGAPGRMLDDRLPGWQQPFENWDRSGRSDAQVKENLDVSWQGWDDTARDVVTAVPDDQAADVFPDPSHQQAYAELRDSRYNPEIYGDLAGQLSDVHRTEQMLTQLPGEEGKHAEGPGRPSVEQLTNRIAGETANGADGAEAQRLQKLLHGGQGPLTAPDKAAGEAAAAQVRSGGHPATAKTHGPDGRHT